MQILTYNEILTKLCDDFDELVTPKVIARANTNVIYLILKAVAKGYEIINNICVVLSNKFNPESCSVEDLNSVADLVGTERYKGSASGLYITVLNSKRESVTLFAGDYTYKLDEDTIFTFEVLEDTNLNTNETKTFIAMSKKIGVFPVTAQSSIEVTSNVIVDKDLKFSCSDNNRLLGVPAETDLEFRKRILSDTNRQDSLSELQTTLRNRPYLFDARVFFNNQFNDFDLDGITVPPSTLAIFYSGEPRNEIAELVASKDIFPTVQTEDSVALHYYNEVFSTGDYQVNIIPFKKFEYKVKLNIKLDMAFISAEEAETQISNTLYSTLNTMVHSDYVKETDIYKVISDMNIAGVEVLNVDLMVGNEVKDFISVPLSRIPELTSITYAYED